MGENSLGYNDSVGTGPEGTLMERIRVKDVALAVDGWPGGGPTTVGIHGLTANHTCWASIADSLSPRMFAGRWNDYLDRYFRYNVETLSVIPKTNHYTILMGHNPKVGSTLRSFLGAR